MKVHTLGPLTSTTLLFRPREGQWRCAIICKLTYQLLPGQSPLAATQEPILPEDLVPLKPHVDVLLVGTAYASRGTPTRSIPVRLIVGELDKSLEACCPRKLSADGFPQEGALVTSVPLRWELAAGGPGTANPVGIAQELLPGYSSRALPQIQPLAWFSADPHDPIPTVGFGPIPPHWPSRLERIEWLGDRAAAILAGDFKSEVLGEDFDPLFFQAAPPDQQIDALRPDERIVLENLFPETHRFVTSLSGMQPRAFLQGLAGDYTPVPLRADTLFIDANRGLCTVTYRGHVEQKTPNEAGNCFLLLEELGQEISAKELEARLGALGISAVASETNASASAPMRSPQNRPNTQLPASFDPDATTEINSANLRPALPFQTRTPRPAVEETDDEPRTAVMNVAGLRAEIEQSAALTRRAEVREEDTPPHLIQPAALVRSPVLPFVNPQTPPPASPQTPPRLAPPPPPPPPSVPAMHGSPLPPAPSFGPPPTNLRSTSTGLPAWVTPAPTAAPPQAPDSVWAMRSTPTGPTATPAPTAQPAPPSQAPAVQAAPAQAAPAQAPASRPESAERAAGKPIELIWYDSAFVGRMRKHPQWGPMFKPAPKPAAPERGKPPPPPPSAEAVEEAQRADVYLVVSRADASSLGELSASRGENDDGGGAPLNLVAGNLAFPLDEIELLKATAAAAAPLAANDKKLKEVLDLVDGVLKMPLEGAPEVTMSFVQRVRDAWLSANRMLPPDYLITHTERTLLNQRHYQKRELLDQEWVRALWSPEGSSAAPIPAYVPAKLSKRLPLFRQFSARLVVEVLPQQDMYESSPIALRVVALARLLDAAAQQPKAKT